MKVKQLGLAQHSCDGDVDELQPADDPISLGTAHPISTGRAVAGKGSGKGEQCHPQAGWSLEECSQFCQPLWLLQQLSRRTALNLLLQSQLFWENQTSVRHCDPSIRCGRLSSSPGPRNGLSCALDLPASTGTAVFWLQW